jgi:hypothetical protein
MRARMIPSHIVAFQHVIISRDEIDEESQEFCTTYLRLLASLEGKRNLKPHYCWMRSDPVFNLLSQPITVGDFLKKNSNFLLSLLMEHNPTSSAMKMEYLMNPKDEEVQIPQKVIFEKVMGIVSGLLDSPTIQELFRKHEKWTVKDLLELNEQE